MTEAFEHKRVLVVGMARSGVAAAELLSRLHATVVLSDSKKDIEGIERLTSMGCSARLAEPAETLVPGSDFVIVSPGVPPSAPVIAAAESQRVPVLSELEFAARLVSGIIVAITGTNGKTTTTTLLGDILRNAGKMTYVAGNIGLPLSKVALDTRPEDYTVLEVSSFQLEHIDCFHPHGAALLNLTADHLNRHGSMEAYGALKESMLKNQTADDFFVYNADDAFCAAVADRAKARVTPFSRRKKQKNGAWLEDGQLYVNGRALCSQDELGPGLPGPHNLENALAAAAMASELSVPPAVIRHTLRTFQGVQHRMETVATIDGVRYINDSKGTNPDSAMYAVRSMTVPTVLIAGGEDKGVSFSGFIQAIRENENIRHVVLIGDTAERLSEELTRSGYTALTISGYDFARAIDTARKLSESGGAVLLSPACASFDMFKDFEERGARFREVIEALQ